VERERKLQQRKGKKLSLFFSLPPPIILLPHNRSLGRVRLWRIPDGCVAAAADVREMVTACSFSPDGSRVVAGTMRGRVRLFNVVWPSAASSPSSCGPAAAAPCPELEPEACIDVRNRRGGDSRGRKVTGVVWGPSPESVSAAVFAAATVPAAGSATGQLASPSSSSPDVVGGAADDDDNDRDGDGDRPLSADAAAASALAAAAAAAVAAAPPRMLVSSNDSRARLFDGLSLRTKFKGHATRHAQLRATFDASGSRLVTGSDDGRVVVWDAPPPAAGRGAAAAAAAAVQSSMSALPPPPPPPPPPRREKCEAFESFRVGEEMVTVALFGPPSAARALQGVGGGGGREAAAAAGAAGETALPPCPLSPHAGGGGGDAAFSSPIPSFSPPPPPPNGVAAAAARGLAGGRAADALARLGGRRAWTRDEAGAALSAGRRAMAAVASGRTARGTLLLAATYGGEVRVYENVAPPAWI